jgi:hypothetical protein
MCRRAGVCDGRAGGAVDSAPREASTPTCCAAPPIHLAWLGTESPAPPCATHSTTSPQRPQGARAAQQRADAAAREHHAPHWAARARPQQQPAVAGARRKGARPPAPILLPMSTRRRRRADGWVCYRPRQRAVLGLAVPSPSRARCRAVLIPLPSRAHNQRTPPLAQLPTAIGEMASLRLLDVSHNMLTRLPSSTGDLEQLRSLKVGRCRLPARTFGKGRGCLLRRLASNPPPGVDWQASPSNPRLLAVWGCM